MGSVVRSGRESGTRRLSMGHGTERLMCVGRVAAVGYGGRGGVSHSPGSPCRVYDDVTPVRADGSGTRTPDGRMSWTNCPGPGHSPAS